MTLNICLVLLSSFFQLIYILTQLKHIHGTVTQNPLTACEGDTITFSCVLTPPDGDMFRSTTPRFIVGNSSATLLDTEINMNISHPDVDLSRISAPVVLGGTLTRVSGDLILHSYLSTDVRLRLGCSAQYVDSGTTTVMVVEETLRLNQTATPSAPSLQSSVSNFNTATCSADISLSWNTPLSDIPVDRYFLYLDGSPLVTTNSNSYILSTILNINTDYQYSVTTMNCAGNSTNSSVNANYIASYSLVRSSQYVCLSYDNSTGGLTVNWELSTPTQPSGVSGLDITYSLQLLYSHSRQCVTYTYTDNTSFTLPSSQLSYNTVLTVHNFTQLDGVETNITANLMIVQQCGQSFNGTAMECFFNSKNPAISPTSSIYISSSIPITSSIPTSTSTEISSSMYMITTVPCNTVSINNNSSSTLLPTYIILTLLFLMSLVINLIFIIAVILLIRKIRQLNSPSKSKPAPSHPYEYIDLDKMSGSISSPTQQQSPQDYVPVSSAHKKETVTTTHYANLK